MAVYLDKEGKDDLENWKTQVRKGYLELCLLLLIGKHKRLYGFDLLDKLHNMEMPLKEGTLYPLLSRMTEEKLLSAVWETENVKGHPRKFYSLTPVGRARAEAMAAEFTRMVGVFDGLNK